MSKLRERLTYANVVSTLCLCILLGGSAYAATKLPKNSVGTKQIKKNAVAGGKIKKSAVTGAKVQDKSLTGSDLADGTITGSNVQDGSLGGADIDQSSLASLRTSNAIGIALTSTCAAAVPFPSGVSAQAVGTACKVTFGSSVLNCAVTATVNLRQDTIFLAAERTVYTARRPSQPTDIYAYPYAAGGPNPLPVDLILVC